MLGRDPDKEWEEFGAKDPYYGVMTCDKFRKNNMEDKHLVEFFQSGRDHVEYILDTIRTSICPGFSPTTALDFGCGVGRVAIPLAGVCNKVVGVDVSSSMLEEARNNCIKQSLTNLEFYTSDDDLSNVSGKFDLIHSTFTLQHIPRERGRKIVRRLIELLSENGVAVLDFLVHREISTIVKTIGLLREKIPLFNHIANVFHKKPLFEPLMEKNIYDLNRIIKILYETGCGNLHIRSFRNGNHLDSILFFQKRRDRAVPHELYFHDTCP
jgi:2-polyprenyl-3-methyl-5-hydroxy-6-metoxy-1,4-benzoquinol methylase